MTVEIHVLVRVNLSLSTQLRAPCVLMAKVLNTCILSFFAYNLFIDRPCTSLYTPHISIHRYIGLLEIEIRFFKNNGYPFGRKHRLDTELYIIERTCHLFL